MVLARVSLRDNLLCVCDPRGVIVFASDDLLWALGLPGPTTRHIGASLLDLLTEEDKLEYKVCVGRSGVGWKGRGGGCRANMLSTTAVDLLLNSPAGGPGRDFILPLGPGSHPQSLPRTSPHSQNAMRRKSGSLLRCQQNGCFVWLDIQSSGQTSRLKRALQRVEKARATCSSLLQPVSHSEHNNNHHHHEPTPLSTTSTSTSSTNNNSPLNHQSKALATASFSCAGGAGRIAGLEEHVLTKEQTLDRFLSTRDQDGGMGDLADDENEDDDDDTATEGSDSEGDEADEVAYPPRPMPMAPARLVESAALPPLGGLSLHESGSECNSACTTSSSTCSSEQLSGPGAAGWTEEEQQRQQQEEAVMVREYSFREIFEYLSAGAKGMSQSTSFCRGGSQASSVLNFGSTAAAAPSSPAAILVRPTHPQRDSRPFSERMAAKCRAAPEESYSVSSYSFTPVASSSSLASSSSWLLQNKYKVSGYVGKAAATLGLGTVVSSTAAATGPPLMTAPPMLEESGWDWYVDV